MLLLLPGPPWPRVLPTRRPSHPPPGRAPPARDRGHGAGRPHPRVGNGEREAAVPRGERRAIGAEAPSGLGLLATDVANDGPHGTHFAPARCARHARLASQPRRRRPMAVTATYRVPGAILTE